MFTYINQTGLQTLNNLTEYPLIASIAFLFADLPIFFIPVFLLGTWILYNYKQKFNLKPNLIFIFYGCIIAILISIIIQQFIHLERPEAHLSNSGRLLLSHIPDASFPSDHASVSFAFLFWLWFFGYKKTFWIYLPFALLMNISRIISWVHWPFDIVAWALIWVGSAWISRSYLSKNKLVKKCNSFIMNVLQYIKL